MKLIKKSIVFIALILLSIINTGMKLASFIINKMAPGIALFIAAFAGYVYFRAGFVADKIIPILGLAFIVAVIGVVIPYVVKGMVELENEMHEYVFNNETYTKKYKNNKKNSKSDCDEYDALDYKLLLTRIQ